MHDKFPPSNRLGRVSAILGPYEIAISILLGYFVFFNVMDLLSTSIALGRGLVESNAALVDLSYLLRVNVVVAMGLTKIGFISGACFMSILGVRTKSKSIKTLAFWSIVAFVFIFVLISFSNLLVILTQN